MLTVKREDACCVKRNYVRSIYDYFSLSEDESKNRTEALKIEPFYITNWEKLHDTYAVSYTHLDVYKRQGSDGRTRSGAADVQSRPRAPPSRTGGDGSRIPASRGNA